MKDMGKVIGMVMGRGRRPKADGKRVSIRGAGAAWLVGS